VGDRALVGVGPSQVVPPEGPSRASCATASSRLLPAPSTARGHKSTTTRCIPART
jgi:hypothetical protein